MTNDKNKTPRRFHGKVEGDPAASNQPFGTTFKFEVLQLGNQLYDHSKSKTIPLPSRPIDIDSETCRGALLGVCIGPEGKADLVGTAFVIGPGVAVTAKHVVEENLSELQAGKERSCLIGIHDGKLTMWEIGSISPLPEQDIAYLGISPLTGFPKNNTYRHFGLSTKMPSIGENIRLLGFRQLTSEPIKKSVQVYSGTVDMFISGGTVQEIFWEGRDRTLLPSVCFELNCHALSGMSGGVAINDNGLVVGLVSSSVDSEDAHETTYVSWLVPSFRMNIPIEWPPGTGRETNLLSETHLDSTESSLFFISNPGGRLDREGRYVE